MLLNEIIQNKHFEIQALRVQNFDLAKVPLARNFLTKNTFSLIAEVKKASPSAGVLVKNYDPAALARQYEEAGASAISVLTDAKYFQGSLEDLKKVKAAVKLPVLCKDFIMDERQVLAARANGADAVLLIERILNQNDLCHFLEIVHNLGMQALVEVHSQHELEKVLNSKAQIIGINNRDLDTLKIDLNTSFSLYDKFKKELKDKIVVSESGIRNREDVQALKEAGFNAILVGESILKSKDIISKIKTLMP